MKNVLVGVSLILLWSACASAQTGVPSTRPLPIEPQPSEISSTLIEPDQQAPSPKLPDAPIPILPNRQDGPMPCPAGVGRPCALLGGRLYFTDPSHMTQHDRSWVGGLRNPMILAGIAANTATFVWDYRTTRDCMAARVCKEGNPIMGQTRAQQLSVGIALDATLYFLAARLKQYGKGNQALAVLVSGAFLHSYAALHSQSLK